MWDKLLKPIPNYVRKKISRTLSGRRYRPKRLCLYCGADNVRAGRKYCSTKCFGLAKRGAVSPNKGKKFSLEIRKKMGASRAGKRPWNYGKPNPKRRGSNCHLWRGGTTEASFKIRTSIEYKNWRRAIFERDNFTCQSCGQRGGDVHAHHIIPFADNTTNFEINNGVTLCVSCHEQTESYPKNLRCAIVRPPQQCGEANRNALPSLKE